MTEPSGPQWCARFAPSRSTADLVPAFRDAVDRFIDQLQTAGASVSIADTFRPPERAYLMHWCCMIVAGQDPAAVPAMAGVDIDWTHGGDHIVAKSAAQAMMARYHIQFPAALVSRHTQRRAIDMNIGWVGTLVMRDADGNPCSISSEPRTGQNPRLWKIGASFGVIKLPSDPPHWSDDGH